MRILKLQFTNINSLAGTWLVDFTGPAYRHGGIFAITGPTGAGKSTILDAICLALYGCTPRLKSISMSENEAMTRLTSVCSAEVTFQTQAGTYRCTWSQRRAHGKPDGNLQQPKHEIVDAMTGGIIESKIRNVAQKIIEVTGMDLDQFTRSMLLAQGKFATFLYADSNERGPVLEQITGTEIYSKISVYVYERWSAEKKDLEKIAIELNGISVLSDEEREARRAELDRLRSRSEELAARAEAQRAMLAWLENVSKLDAELSEAEEQCRGFDARHAEAEPARTKLARAEQASALEVYFAPLLKLRVESANLRIQLARSTDHLPEASRIREEAQTRLDSARIRREELRTGMQRESVLWKKARELDATIREKRKRRDEYLRVLEERRNEYARQAEKRRTLAAELDAIKVEQGSLREYFDAHASDATLSGSMGAIDLTIDGIRSGLLKLAQRRAMLSAAARERETMTEDAETARAECDRHGKAARDAEAAAESSDSRLEQLLCGRDAADVRRHAAVLAEREKMLDEASRLLNERSEARMALQAHEQKKALLLDRQDKGRSHAVQAEQEKAAKQKEVDLCEELLRMQRTIDDLVEHRAHLKDGEPCPLCGSIDHPYASGQVPKSDEKMELLKRAKSELEGVSMRLEKYNRELAKIESDIGHLDEQIAERKEQVSVLGMKAQSMCDALGVQCELQAAAAKADDVRIERQATDLLVRAVDAAIDTRDKVRKNAEEARMLAHASQLNYEQASAHFAKKDDELKRLEADCETMSGEINEMLNSLQLRCEPYGIAGVSIDSLGAVHEALRNRRDAWEEQARKREVLEKREQEVAPELKSVDALLARSGQMAEAAETDAAQSGSECEMLEAERTLLFGNADPDEEERKMSDALADIDAAIVTCGKEAERCAGELAGLEKEISMIRKRLDDCGGELIENEQAFGRRLTGAGFGSEEEFVAVRLSDEERTGLQRIVNELRDEGKRLESVREQKRIELQREREKGLTGRTSMEVSAALKEAETACAEAQQTIGALENQLRRDDEQRGARSEKAAEQEKRQREYRRWDDLNELIGSASGKKFQKIAQAVTFEMMVAQANKVLRKMSPRYFLVCDAKTDLEMNIVDQYQAGEVRSTKNLSGGESFIVSLSLALGLSHMASRNVRVDSLFLDEGFGTLDEEALDVALTTLSELQQEGKTIGVISHVGALKERIGTQIVVTPDSGGRSTLSGPGCRRIN